MSTPPLYESYNPHTLRATEVTVDSDTGHLVFVHAQNTRPIVESCKQLASNFDPAGWRKNTVSHVARIPNVIVWQLKRLGIWDDEKAMNKWLDDPDNAVFRVDDRRKL